jgi:hypothetical protein
VHKTKLKLGCCIEHFELEMCIFPVTITSVNAKFTDCIKTRKTESCLDDCVLFDFYGLFVIHTYKFIKFSFLRCFV